MNIISKYFVHICLIACLVITIAFAYLSNHSRATEDSLDRISESISLDFDKAFEDLTTEGAASDFLNSTTHSSLEAETVDDFYATYIYKNAKAIYWSGIDFPLKKVNLEAGFPFVITKGKLVDSLQVFMNLNLFSRADSTLNPNIKARYGLSSSYRLSQDGIGIPFSVNGKEVTVQKVYSDNLIRWSYVSFFFLFATLILFIRLISDRYISHSKPFHTEYKPLFYLAILTILYTLLFHTGILNFYTELSITEVSQSSKMKVSLASLCIHLIFIYAVSVVLQKSEKLKSTRLFSSAIIVASTAAIATGLTLLIGVIESFVLNSNIHLEIEEILKFDYFSTIVLLLLLVTCMLYYYLTTLFIRIIDKQLISLPVRIILFTLGIVLAIPLFKNAHPDINPIIYATFLIAYLLMQDVFSELKSKNITLVIWWMIIFSIFLSSVIFYFSLNKDIETRSGFVEAYYTPERPSIHNKFKVVNDSLIGSELFKTLGDLPYPAKLDRNDLKSYISNLIDQIPDVKSNYTQMEIEGFDRFGTSIFAHHYANYNSIKQSLSIASSRSENIYYSPTEKTYFLNYYVENDFHRGSPFHIILSFTDPTVLSEGIPIDSDFNYIVINDNQVLEHRINRPSQAQPLAILKGIHKTEIKDAFSYVVSKPSNNVVIVAYRKIARLIKPISLFSIIFSLAGILLFLLSLFNTKFEFLPEDINLKFYDKSSLRTKIQLAIIMLILISFLIIGLTTAYYFRNVLEANQLKAETEESITLINDIQATLSAQSPADNESANIIINNKLREISTVHRKELSLYNTDGMIESSSVHSPFSLRMPFTSFLSLKSNEIATFRMSPNSSEWTSVVPLYLNSGQPYAYLGIHYAPQITSSRSILEFLSTVLNVYVFLFLIAGAISIVIANSITRPLSTLAEKLRLFKLGKRNEPLEWNTKDEIGALITTYNDLIVKLDESAQIIARTERDSAWREMAKQVAHEIKNPLTPMKLSIQYLHKATEADPTNAPRLIKSISNTLIEQIDSLTQIANEFSNFAKMPQADNEKIVLNEIVESIHDLFRKREDMDILLSAPINDLYIYADRNHLVRILNNLVKNAIQAIPTDRRGKIELALTQNEDRVIISVTDNGVGIPDHMKKKVFEPNFTTKNSGTGLGLAISANMIESFNGKIYFTTEVNVGTVFYVEIPLMRLEDNFNDTTRVSLDD